MEWVNDFYQVTLGATKSFQIALNSEPCWRALLGGAVEHQYLCGESSMQQETVGTAGMEPLLQCSDSKGGVNYIPAVAGSSDQASS